MQDTLSKEAQGRRPNTTGSTTAPKPFLNDSQWELIKDLFPDSVTSSKGGRLPSHPGTASKAFTGSSKQELDGKIYQTGTLLSQRAGGGSAGGQNPERLKKHGID